MCKFNEEKYTEDAISEKVQYLKERDYYPWEILGDFAGLSGSMMRQVSEGNRVLKGTNLAMLMRGLLKKDGNARLFKVVLPDGYSLVKDGEVVANGCPNDEYIDGKEAISTFYNGHKTGNIDMMDEGIKQHEEVGRRMKAERARKAGRKS